MADFSLLSCGTCGGVFAKMSVKCPICGCMSDMEVHELFFDELDHTHTYLVHREIPDTEGRA